MDMSLYDASPKVTTKYHEVGKVDVHTRFIERLSWMTGRVQLEMLKVL
jgi:hypothetical protein